jgi:hypothetical protein
MAILELFLILVGKLKVDVRKLCYQETKTLFLVTFSKIISIYFTTDDKFHFGFIKLIYNVI